MGAVNIGIVGLGLMGERHVQAFDKMPLINVYAVCDASRERAEVMGEKYHAKCFTDLEEMLKDPELTAVDIVLPDNIHRHAIELAVRYRKHIMVEKPMACTLEDAKAIYEVTRDYDRTFMIGHILRFDPRYSAARDAVRSGQLGDVISVYARRNSPVTGPRHYHGASDLSTHVMVHDIDAIQWIMDSKIKTVFSKASKKVLADLQMTDCIHTLFTAENGALGTIEACWILPETTPSSIDDQLELIGSKAAVYTDSCGDGLQIIDRQRADAPDSRHWPDLNGGLSGALYEELTDFVRCVSGQKQSIISAEDGLSVVKVVDAIERSILEGREITIE